MTLGQVSKQFIDIIFGWSVLLICHIPESGQGGRLITRCQLTWGPLGEGAVIPKADPVVC